MGCRRGGVRVRGGVGNGNGIEDIIESDESKVMEWEKRREEKRRVVK